MKGILLVLFAICIYANIFPKEEWEHGLIDLDNGNDMFYILFKARHPKPVIEDTPVILWITGGPGCSGLIALFMENGPTWILKNGTQIYNEYSWNNNADVIYIDQPIGTGFSNVSDPKYYCNDEECVSKYIYTFLCKIWQKHPEYAVRPFSIIGESYGGHYVPYLASYILKSGDKQFNFKSIGVGNGLTDGLHQ